MVWCACCRRCVMFSVMRDSELPRTPFDLVITHMERAPQQFQLDNGCNLHSFALAREPEYFAGMRVLVDEPHYRGHTNCSANYSTGKSGHSVHSMMQVAMHAMTKLGWTVVVLPAMPVACPPPATAST
jgi:hypothetical protein